MALMQIQGQGYVPDPFSTGVETTIVHLVQWIELVVESIGAFIVLVGILLATREVIRSWIGTGDRNYRSARLLLARHLSLALEFQLGADILSTAIMPTWSQIGRLAAIAVIRTALNYFLSIEMNQERWISGQKENGADSERRTATS